MELPFVRLSLTNQLPDDLSTEEILTNRQEQIRLSNQRARQRLRKNSRLVDYAPSPTPDLALEEVFIFELRAVENLNFRWKIEQRLKQNRPLKKMLAKNYC